MMELRKCLKLLQLKEDWHDQGILISTNSSFTVFGRFMWKRKYLSEVNVNFQTNTGMKKDQVNVLPCLIDTKTS